jgi:RNA polymerase sigma factor (sigma-70 family)
MAYGLAYSVLGDSHASEDVAQEAFVEAWRSLSALREPRAFPGWFRRIVLKYCDRHTRRTTNVAAPLAEAADLPSTEPTPLQAAEEAELNSRVADALGRLPRREREVIVLSYFVRYSQGEGGEFLDIPLGTVRSRLRAARRRLLGRMLHMAREELDTTRPCRDDEFVKSVLFQAVRDVDIVKVEQITEANPKLALERDDDGNTPLTTLMQDRKFGEWRSEAWDRRRRVYQALVSAGADPGLGGAVEGDDLASVRRYIERNPSLLHTPIRAVQSRLQWSEPQTPLTVAANRGRIKIMELLLGAGDFPQEELDAALADAAFQSQTEAMERLLQRGANIETATGVLVAAATNLSVSSAEFLLSHGANPASADSHERTPLAAATCSNCRSFPYRDVPEDPARFSGRVNQIRFVETLIEAGADVSDSPIMSIVRGRSDEVSRWADGHTTALNAPMEFQWIVDAPTAPVDGATLLHFAVEFDEIECAKRLIAHGMDLNAPITRDANGIGGYTPIFNAVAHNYHRPPLRYLVEEGADLSVSATFDGRSLRAAFGQDAGFDRRDLTPLAYCMLTRDKAWHSWAREEKEAQIALLREHGAADSRRRPGISVAALPLLVLGERLLVGGIRSNDGGAAPYLFDNELLFEFHLRGPLSDLRRQLRRHDNNALLIPNDDVAGDHGDLPARDRNLDFAGVVNRLVRVRVHRSGICCEPGLRDHGTVAIRAVRHDTDGAPAVNPRRENSAHRARARIPTRVDHKHLPLCNLLNPNPLLVLEVVERGFVQVFTRRDVPKRVRRPGHLHVGLQWTHAVHEAVRNTEVPQHRRQRCRAGDQ